jgi:hypothetical protein
LIRSSCSAVTMHYVAAISPTFWPSLPTSTIPDSTSHLSYETIVHQRCLHSWPCLAHNSVFRALQQGHACCKGMGRKARPLSHHSARVLPRFSDMPTMKKPTTNQQNPPLRTNRLPHYQSTEAPIMNQQIPPLRINGHRHHEPTDC